MKRRLRDSHGFSLVELIIVVAIMAVLIGLLAPQYLKYVEKSKVQSLITNTKGVADAIMVLVVDSSASSNETYEKLLDFVQTGEELDLTTDDAEFIRKEVGDDNLTGTISFNTDSNNYISFTYKSGDGFYEVDYRAEERAAGNGTLVKEEGDYKVYSVH